MFLGQFLLSYRSGTHTETHTHTNTHTDMHTRSRAIRIGFRIHTQVQEYGINEPIHDFQIDEYSIVAFSNELSNNHNEKK